MVSIPDLTDGDPRRIVATGRNLAGVRNARAAGYRYTYERSDDTGRAPLRYSRLDLCKGVGPMGRGRAKAKQTKVARELKYRNQGTDFTQLQRELHGDERDDAAATGTSAVDEVDEYDPYSSYADTGDAESTAR